MASKSKGFNSKKKRHKKYEAMIKKLRRVIDMERKQKK